MPLAAIITGTIALILVSTCIYRRIFWRSVNNSQKVQKFDEANTCHRILDCKSIEEAGPEITIVPIESRAKPNQRLTRVFEIDNAFTTFDDQYGRTFKSSAAKKLQAVNGEKWKEIADMAGKLIDRWIKREKNHQEGIALVTFVQTVTMSLSLYVLFDTLNPLELEESHITQAAGYVNELWILSKETPLDVDLAAAKRSKLQDALQHISSDFRFTPKETPLNFILPAYETLWRVVLRCFIKVSFRNVDSAENWRGVLRSFFMDPSDSQFKKCAFDADVSVNFIVFEALRLYPPTSRVYRQYEIGSKRSKTVAADIESCQRSESIWGSESKLFKPSRWNDLNKEAKDAFMPFGGGQFVCPARTTFGPRIIGVLVAALATKISLDDWMIGAGASHEAAIDYDWPDGPLESGRQAFEPLKLWRKPALSVEQQGQKL